MTAESSESAKHFIQQIVEDDLASGKHEQIVTRFPPEPNGYLHIGHAKAICVSYGLAEMYKGRYHLRFDDTNPETEDTEYVESIQEDIRWLGFDWGEHLFFASDYFERIYDLIDLLELFVVEFRKPTVGHDSIAALVKLEFLFPAFAN